MKFERDKIRNCKDVDSDNEIQVINQVIIDQTLQSVDREEKTRSRQIYEDFGQDSAQKPTDLRKLKIITSLEFNYIFIGNC